MYPTIPINWAAPPSTLPLPPTFPSSAQPVISYRNLREHITSYCLTGRVYEGDTRVRVRHMHANVAG